jgi:hypothetical protein
MGFRNSADRQALILVGLELQHLVSRPVSPGAYGV